jgi:predicted  nucleic acid-binding Zn-ribbon protein
MNKLIKIAPIIVILACGGSLFMAFRLYKIKQDHLATIAQQKDDLEKTNNDLTRTRGNLKNTQTSLTSTSNELAQVGKTLDDTKASLDQKTQEAEGLKTQMAAQTKQWQATKTELAAAQAEMQKVVEVLKLVGIEGIQNVTQIGEKVRGLADEKTLLSGQLAKMRDENQQLQDKIVELSTTPVNTRGKVASVQDRWGFLVLNIGEEQKVRKHSQFLIYRDSKPVGVVQVLSVGPTTSVAEILPEYRRGTPRVGDVAVH